MDRKPVDLDLDHVLGSMPRKVFEMKRLEPQLHPLTLPDTLSVHEALCRVLRLPAVASKRYLTNKVCVSSFLPVGIKLRNYRGIILMKTKACIQTERLFFLHM